MEYTCSDCGNSGIWNNKVINLQLDHINGIRDDNRLSNLRFLCPNCHSQTETFCTKNSNSKKIDQFDIDEIINIFGKCKSITGVILNMGIYDNTKNRNKLKLIKEKYKLEFK